MNSRVILLVAAALLLAGGSILMMKSYLSSQQVKVVPEAPKPTHETYVLVAAKNLPAGSFVRDRDFRWQAWPDESLANSYLVKGQFKANDLVGGVVRNGIREGEPVTIGRVVKSGERGFLAAVLRPGFRASSFKIGAASGVAGLIFPGDRVDVILSHTVRGEDKRRRRAGETILENVRILAIDRRLNDQGGAPKVGKTVTLELSPKQVEVLTVARSLGSLSLSLRSLAENNTQLRRIAAGDEDAIEALGQGEPRPARTYTWENEVSVLVPWDAKKFEGLTVARGRKVRKFSSGIEQGRDSDSSSDDAESSPQDIQSAEVPE